MAALSKQEKGKLVLDLYFNQGKNYRQIAKEARISPREIKRILDKDAEDVQEETPMSIWARAYTLFEAGKSPLEVAIELNLRSDKIREFYKEFWDLKQLRDFNKLYFETGGHITPILKLYEMTKSAGYSVKHIVTLLKLANNDLPRLEHVYDTLKSEVSSLDAEKQTSTRIIEDYNNHIKGLGQRFADYCMSCEEEGARLNELQQRRMKLQASLTPI
jgi:DNA-binding Lrp family transcriptional regulator